MELLAVRQARLIALLNAEELNPKGLAIAHEFMNAYVERYQFVKRPTTADEILDSQNKGISFEVGKLGKIGITKVTLFDWGIVIDTNASTDACEEILQDMLKWGAATYGLADRASLITRRSYVSELVFSSEMALAEINPTFKKLAAHLTEKIKGYAGDSMPFEINGISLAFDNSQSKQVYTPFQVYRLVETPFSENKYYSAAPLQTADHLAVIADLEVSLK